MTKKKVISEVVTAVRKALDEKLDHEEYSEFLRGSVSFRLDLIQKPTKHFVNLDLPSRKAESTEPKSLKIEFHRRYTRRRCLELPATEGLNNAV
jgi:hypothetical protein